MDVGGASFALLGWLGSLLEHQARGGPPATGPHHSALHVAVPAASAAASSGQTVQHCCKPPPPGHGGRPALQTTTTPTAQPLSPVDSVALREHHVHSLDAAKTVFENLGYKDTEDGFQHPLQLQPRLGKATGPLAAGRSVSGSNIVKPVCSNRTTRLQLESGTELKNRSLL
eukprot:4248455-Amphidinium_carterae.3